MVGGDPEGVIAFTINFNDVPGNAGIQVTAITSGVDVVFDKTVPIVTDI